MPYEVKFALGGGWDGLQQKLQTLSERANSGPLQQSHQWSAEQILETARALCPVKSGALRDSLYIQTTVADVPAVHNDLSPVHLELSETHVELNESHIDLTPQHFELYQTHLDIPLRVGGGVFQKVTKEIRSDSPYAMSTEFGNSREAAHPFMRPAVDMVRSSVHDAMVGGLKQLVAET